MKRLLQIIMAAVSLFSLSLTALAQGTVFTYQGRVTDNGTNFSGNGLFKFALVTGTNANYTTFWSNDGTSVNGSEPVAAITINVSNGLFTVVLGDTNQPNMALMDAALFTQPNLRLRIWFSDGVNGSLALNPPQNLTPAPYAIYASTASNLLNGLSVQQATNGSPNIIAGSSVNYVLNGVFGATIAGGGSTNFGGVSYTNSVTGSFGTVSGGLNNTAGNILSTAGGGYNNFASGYGSTISGGFNNQATNYGATVPGGQENAALGICSFAAGYSAKALHDGSFVWSDYVAGPFVSTINNQFSVRANGGVRLVTGSAGVKLGSSGQYFAPGGVENLRIIRGVVDSAGNILHGSDFTVTRTGTGAYTVTFSSTFADFPAVTVSAQSGLARIATTTNVTNSGAQIRTFDANGAAVDAQFHFIVIGPQ